MSVMLFCVPSSSYGQLVDPMSEIFSP